MDLKKKLLLVFLSPILLIFLIYGSGFIAQFIINYNRWQSAGGDLASRTSPDLPSTSFFACVKAVFTMPEGLIGIGVIIVVVAFIILFVFRIGRDGGGTPDQERNFTYSDSGVYGTAGWMSDKEMKEVLEVSEVRRTTGTILGKQGKKVVVLPNDTMMNRNMAVYGASGSRKSRGIIRPAVFQAVRRGESMIITDPKSELYNDLAQYLIANGYTVRVFNLIHPQHSDSWNCLGEVGGDELAAQIFADTIIKNTIVGRGDHFWDNSELNLLKALVLYVSLVYPKETRNIGEVYNILCNTQESDLNKMFDALPNGHPAKAPYNIYKQAGDTVRGGVIIGLGSRLQVFQTDLIRKITAFNEINLELPAKQKCAYFCITSDQNSTFDFLSSLFFSFLFIRLVGYADTHGPDGKCPVPVTFLLDEFPNAGTILDFKKKIVRSVCRRKLGTGRYPVAGTGILMGGMAA